MKKTSRFLGGLILVSFTHYAEAEKLIRICLDRKNNIHILTENEEHRQLTRKGHASMPKLAPDKETVAWLKMNMWKTEGDDKAGADELVIYRNGKSTSIKCTPFIRDYWFWNNGSQVAIDCGGTHFAGREILYDARTLKELANFDQANVPLEKRPEWSSSQD